MMTELISLKRKVYRKGGSFFTGVPSLALHGLDASKKYKSVWRYDAKQSSWLVSFEADSSDNKV